MRINSIYHTVLLIFFVLLVGCGSNPGDAAEITATGTIKTQGMTTYMYGTHILLNDTGQTLYALKSDTINLDTYLDKKVTVSGDLVEGYPVDFGPDYLNVKAIQ